MRNPSLIFVITSVMKFLLPIVCAFLAVPLLLCGAPKPKESADDLKKQESALSLYRQGRYAEAEKAFRLLIADQEARLGLEAPTTLGNKSNLVVVVGAAGRSAEAEKMAREVLAAQVRVLGPDDWETCVTRTNLANALLDQGKLAEAEQEDRTVVEINTRRQGPETRTTLTSRINLADVLNAEGKYAVAEKENRALLPLLQRVVGPENEYTLMCRNNLAENLQGQGHWAEADAENRAVLAIYERIPSDGRGIYQSCYNLALCLVGEQRLSEALRYAQRAEKGRLDLLGAKHADTIKARELRERIESHSPAPSGATVDAGDAKPAPNGTGAPVKSATSLDPALVGRYMKPGEAAEYFDIRADSTFTLVQGLGEGVSADCAAQGNTVTLTVPGKPIVIQIVNGTFAGPDGKKWQKVPGAAPAPPPTSVPNFIGKPNALAETQKEMAGKLAILKCENNVKQMLIGCTLWATDHGGSYPDDLADLFTKKYMGAGKPDMLKVPMGTDEKTTVYLYYGKKHGDTMPAAKILILSKWKDDQGRHIIGRRDGSVELAVPKKDDYPAPGVKS